MKQSKLGEGFNYRDQQPENEQEVIDLLQSEFEQFIKWTDVVPPKRKESLFWECDYDEQLYLDTALNHIFKYFQNLAELDSRVVTQIVYVIACNHEQGNILAWMNSELPISYLSMSIRQFKYLARIILRNTEADERAVFQVVAIFRKLNPSEIDEEEISLLEQHQYHESEFVRDQVATTMEHISNLK